MPYNLAFYRNDFRQIPDIGDDKYWINSEGYIININTGYVLIDRIDRSGYRAIQLWIKDYGKKTYKIHRLVAQTFIPNPNNLPIVLHLDNNPLNCNAENLAWGTQSDNVRQAIHDKHHYLPDSRKVYTIYDPNTEDTIAEILGPEALAKAIEYQGQAYTVSCVTRRNHPLKYGPYKGYRVKVSHDWIGQKREY